jgi:hypothetical protein
MSVRRCLLIFDNAEETTLRSGGLSTTEAANLADCLPQSELRTFIFTTTNGDIAETLARQNVIALQKMTADTAQRMLQDRLARPLSHVEQQEAEHLLRELSYLPLVVVQAAACMSACGMTVQQYRAQLDEHNKSAIKHNSDSSESKLRHERSCSCYTICLRSVPTCRDARCDGTPFLPDIRIACNVLKNRQVRFTSILQLSFYQHISLRR